MSGKIVPNVKKVALRKVVDQILASMSQEDRLRQSKVIGDKILSHPKYKEAKRIALFLSLPSEVNTEPILRDILSRGDAAFVPQYSKGKMRMLRVLPGDLEAMPETSWGIKQHAKDVVREDALDNGGLDLVIAPGAAFTAAGWRLGHGGGYYDRYLAELKRRHAEGSGAFVDPYILAVGFKQQLFEEVPVDAQDVKVDEVVTAD
ncbi:5-formyltetrahydrofolate cyclo-ligase [Plutella xylostella]|uniref:5-formyltetrahydrofolate cyclo-ligase n=1 Tax=Plutella xylostella TaxID=51655 RepID=UPI00203269F9|nr:5-formyltetrahydrofolate cyclo-ligase [Plutella xylostella]